MRETTANAVKFADGDGNELHGRLYGSLTDADSAVVFCHGFLGTQDVLAPEFAVRLVGGGPRRAMLTFDYTGFGQSHGPSHRLDPDLQCRNVAAAVAYAAQRAPHLRDIALLGVSFGSGIALAAGARLPLVQTIVALSAYRSGEEWLRDMRPLHQLAALMADVDKGREATTGGRPPLLPLDDIFIRDPKGAAFERELRRTATDRPTHLDTVSVERILQFRPIDSAPTLRTKKVLFLHAEHDVTMWPEHAREFAAAVSGTFELLPNVDHYQIYEPAYMDQLCQAIDHFLRGQP